MSSERAPAWLCWLIARLAPGELRDVMVGDLHERWAEVRARKGRFRASLWSCGELLRARPVALRRALRQADHGYILRRKRWTIMMLSDDNFYGLRRLRVVQPYRGTLVGTWPAHDLERSGGAAIPTKA